MLVESSKLHDPEVWNLGTWNLELGTWNLEPGTWNQLFVSTASPIINLPIRQRTNETIS